MSVEAYRTPLAEPPPEPSDDRGRGRAVAISAVGLLWSPAALLLVVAVSVFRPLRGLAESGQADPEAIARQTSLWIGTAMVAMLLSIVGGVLALVSLLGRGNRELWFRVWLMVVVPFQCLFFPVGTVVGAVVLLALIIRWKEFGPRLPAI